MFYIKSYIYALLYPFLCWWYGIKVARTQEEKERVFRFRYEIYRKELSHHFLDAKLKKEGMLFDETDFDDNCYIVYATNRDEIIGTITYIVWDSGEVPEQIKSKYDLKEEYLKKIAKISECRFLQISKKYRKSLLVLVMMCYTCFLKVKYPKIIHNLIFLNCQPGLVNLYTQLGAFAYTNKMIFEEYKILQVPLCFPTYDCDNFKKVGSIFYYLAKKYLKIHKKQMPIDQYNEMIKAAHYLPHLKIHKTPEQVLAICENNLTNLQYKQFSVILSFFKDVVVLPIKANTSIIRKGLVDFDMYLLVRGNLGIYLDDKLVATLQPGAIFGELALASRRHVRLTDAVSLTDIKMVLIPRTLLLQLEKKNIKGANQLLRVLCETIVEKLENANDALANLVDEKTHEK